MSRRIVVVGWKFDFDSDFDFDDGRICPEAARRTGLQARSCDGFAAWNGPGDPFYEEMATGKWLRGDGHEKALRDGGHGNAQSFFAAFLALAENQGKSEFFSMEKRGDLTREAASHIAGFLVPVRESSRDGRDAEFFPH